jgi:RHS repeat-associated protein
MFAGVRYDIEIGLYYNRARYYNPFTGRFLQTDPIGYGDGMNWYAYCRNNPVGLVDPAGSWASYSFNWVAIADTDVWVLQVLCWDDPEQKHLGTDFYFTDWEDMWTYVKNGGDFCDVSFNFQSWSIYAMNGEQSDSGHPDTPPGSGSGWGTAALAGGICLVIPGPFDEAALGGILLGKAAVAAAKTAAEAAAIVAAGVAADMVLEHWARTRPGSTMGTTGPPNGVSVEDRGGGHGTIREYGPDGRAARDYDLGHDHGSGDPHVHDWDWSKPIPRGDGRSLRPGE